MLVTHQPSDPWTLPVNHQEWFMAPGSEHAAMKKIKMTRATAILALTAIVWGCQGLAQTPPSRHEPPVAVGSSAPAYYYFSAAQIKRRQGDYDEAVWHLQQALQHDPHSVFLHLELAQLLLIKKDQDGALELVQTLLADHPNHVKALILAGRIYQQRNDAKAAKAVFEKVLETDPDQQSIYLLLGRTYWDEGDVNNAARVFGRMVKQYPTDYVSHYFYGKALVALGELARAEKALLKSLALEPNLDEPHAELLKIYKIRNQQAKISQTYKIQLQNDPNNHTAALGLAEQLEQQGEGRTARKLLLQLGRKAQDDNRVISAVFENYFKPKRYDEALWALGGMLGAAENNSELNYWAGAAATELQRHDTAVPYLNKVAPTSRYYHDAVIRLAVIFHDMGSLEKAIAVMQKALDHAPDKTDYYIYLGSYYEELERYEEAIQSLRQGIAEGNPNPKLYFRIGVIYDRMGDRQASIQVMRQAVQLAPDDAEALNYLGYTYADLGINLDEAKTLVQSALKIKPDDGYISDSMGWIFYKQGAYDEALQWLQRAVSLVPDDPTILEHLGDVHLKMDSKKKALDYYQRALNLKDKGKEVLEKKIRLLQR